MIWDQNTNPPAKWHVRRKVLDSTTTTTLLPVFSLVESPAVFVVVSHNLVNHVFNTILFYVRLPHI
jgi:hypothetical protein